MKPWTRLDWLILLLFAVLVSLFYWRILTPNLADRQSFPPGDFSHQFWAFATFEARELSAGRLPLWNPYTFAGAPFWADVQSAVFYPPSLLTILLSTPEGFSLFALEIEAIAHFWLAATFMYLFSRRLTRSRAAAFIAALTLTFSGYLTGYPSQQLAVLETDVWLPLILFFIHRAHEKWKIGRAEDWKDEKNCDQSLITNYQLPITNLLLAGLAWGIALLAGHTQSALIVAYISSAYLLFLHYAPPTTQHAPRFPLHILRLLPSLLLFLLTGLALAAIQFIPAVEYTLRSVRAAGTYDNMAGGLPLIDLIQLLLPGQVSFYSPLYVGVVGLILGLWVVFTQPNRHIIFWALVAGLTLLISFGGNTFLYSPLYLTTPGFSIFRGQERWAFAAAFSLCVLAAYGFNQLRLTLDRLPKISNYQLPITNYQLPITSYQSPNLPISQSPIPTLQSLTTTLLLLALLLTFLCFYGLNDSGWTPNSPFFKLLGAATLLTVLLALTWLLWKVLATFRLPPALLTGLTTVLICFDLFSVNWQTNLYPQLPERHTQMPHVVAAIKEDAAKSPGEPYRVYNEFRLYDNYGIPFEIEDLWGASPLRPDRYDKFLAPPMPIERVWELLNVKYVITWRQELFVPSTIIYEEPADDGATYVHRLADVGPRAWLVSQAEIAGDETILQKIADPNFDRWRIALLEPEAESYLEPINQTIPHPNNGVISNTQHITPTTSHAIHTTHHTPQTLSIQVETDAPALLILSEPDYPGWQATVDGQPTPILRAYYLLRAVPLPPGQHTVELIFRPATFTIGAIISGLTVLFVISAAFLYHRPRRANR